MIIMFWNFVSMYGMLFEIYIELKLCWTTIYWKKENTSTKKIDKSNESVGNISYKLYTLAIVCRRDLMSTNGKL